MSPVPIGPMALQVGVTAIIPAAGSGSRVGGATPKQFLPLAGVPVLVRTLTLFAAERRVDDIVVVAAPDQMDATWELIRRYRVQKVTRVVPGGAERQQSVARGLAAVTSRPRIVVVHDAARPLLPPERLAALLEVAGRYPALCMAVPVADTLKRAVPVSGDGDLPAVDATVARDSLWLAQTPQVFRAEVLAQALAAAEKDGYVGTDCAAAVERVGVPVTLFPGSRFNLKLTTAEDFALAEGMLASSPSPPVRG